MKVKYKDEHQEMWGTLLNVYASGSWRMGKFTKVVNWKQDTASGCLEQYMKIIEPEPKNYTLTGENSKAMETRITKHVI